MPIHKTCISACIFSFLPSPTPASPKNFLTRLHSNEQCLLPLHAKSNSKLNLQLSFFNAQVRRAVQAGTIFEYMAKNWKAYTVQGQGQRPLALGPTLARPSRARAGPALAGSGPALKGPRARWLSRAGSGQGQGRPWPSKYSR